jgi:hypothetical protein
VIVNLRADVTEARRFYTELSRTHIDRAAANALNVVGRETRNAAIAEVQGVRRVPVRMVSKAIILRRAMASALEAIIIVTGLPISLKEYGARQNAAGVEVNVEGRPKTIRGAFGPGMSAKVISRFTYTKGGKRYSSVERSSRAPQVLGGHVYRREGKKRLPIKKLFGPSLPTGFIKQVVQRNLETVYSARWPVVLKEKLEDQLAKLRASLLR